MGVCNLCPRNCNADREKGNTGFCREDDNIKVAKAYLHLWEEPCISGTKGSGTVFFTGCNLRCIYCQNHEISLNSKGKTLTQRELADVFLKLMEKGAHNINLVTPTHFADKIAFSVEIAKNMGLAIPIIYNTSGYEKQKTLEITEKYADVYLPDFKYAIDITAEKYSSAPDYPKLAKSAIEEMVRQRPKLVFDKDGLVKKGVIVRHLLLPGNLKNSRLAVEYLYKTYGDSIFISLMNQYTPVKSFEKYPELSQTPSRREYEKLVDYALSLGVKNAYIQDAQSSDKAYIPEFDFEGI